MVHNQTTAVDQDGTRLYVKHKTYIFLPTRQCKVYSGTSDVHSTVCDVKFCIASECKREIVVIFFNFPFGVNHCAVLWSNKVRK